MNYLLDTNVFIWFMAGNDQLPEGITKTIVDRQNHIYLSAISIWEIIIKERLGKLHFDTDIFKAIDIFLNEGTLLILPLMKDHLLPLRIMPLHHRDPFDRVLISQAFSESMRLLYTDECFKDYTDFLI